MNVFVDCNLASDTAHPSPRSVLELEGRDYYETVGVIFSRTALDNNQPVT